jgi:hypothetical protein
MTHFWRVSVTLDRDKTEDTMTFVFEDGRRGRTIMRAYESLFPTYESISVDPCDWWGRAWRATCSLCPTCGQPDGGESCSHERLPDSGHKAIGVKP